MKTNYFGLVALTAGTFLLIGCNQNVPPAQQGESTTIVPVPVPTPAPDVVPVPGPPGPPGPQGPEGPPGPTP
jgi:hypothetical protein